MPGFVMRDWLPRAIRSRLWGDRERWGLTIREKDTCWAEWNRISLEFYAANQRQGIGTAVNDAGYRVMSRVDLSGKRVLEIGPGDIRHTAFWQGKPDEYWLIDIQSGMLEQAKHKLGTANVPFQSRLVQRGEALPLPDASIDVVVSFYSLEHIYPLAPYLEEIDRVLAPGGKLIGAIPTEGGLAWGTGRALTSRRWLKKHTRLDPDKIICWEHPNFADEIVAQLDRRFEQVHTGFWPLPGLPLLDFNLIIHFVYHKRD